MKKTCVLLLLVALLLGFAVPVQAANVMLSNQSLKVDGVPVTCEKYNINDENYFKLRDLAMALNGSASQFSVDYDPEAKAVRIETGKPYTPVGGELTQGEDKSDTARLSPQTVYINGEQRSDLTAYHIGGELGNNYFRLKDLGPALGFGVDYDIPSRTVLVTTGTGGAGTASAAGRLGKTADAGREYLDRITFLGDSTTYGIGYYYRHGYTDLCPASQVWTPKSGTMSLWDYDTATIVYPATGKEILIQDAAKAAQPEILLITLGVNGISSLGEEEFKADYAALVKNILAVSPDTKIILNSIYPVADSWKYQKSINNKKITAANGWIE